MKIAPLVLFCGLILMGCTKPDRVPDHLMRCSEEPTPVGIETEKQFIEWVEEVRSAGHECRLNLEAIQKIVGSTSY